MTINHATVHNSKVSIQFAGAVDHLIFKKQDYLQREVIGC